MDCTTISTPFGGLRRSDPVKLLLSKYYGPGSRSVDEVTMTKHDCTETNPVSNSIQSLAAVMDLAIRMQRQMANFASQLSEALDRLQNNHNAVGMKPISPGRVAATESALADEVDGRHTVSPIALETTSGAATQLTKCPPTRRQTRRKASSALSQKEQQVWACVYIQGKTVTQTAIELSCTPQNISKHLNNAQRKIKARQSRSANTTRPLPEDSRGQVTAF
jgi:DNA-binding CsgD family transcriptional regulator